MAFLFDPAIFDPAIFDAVIPATLVLSVLENPDIAAFVVGITAAAQPAIWTTTEAIDIAQIQLVSVPVSFVSGTIQISVPSTQNTIIIADGVSTYPTSSRTVFVTADVQLITILAQDVITIQSN